MATYGHPAWKYSAVKRFGTWLRLGTRAKQPKGAVERELLPSDMTNLDFSISSSLLLRLLSSRTISLWFLVWKGRLERGTLQEKWKLFILLLPWLLRL